jgi:Uncharacterized protein conserved in bacteria (DUF2247).
MKTFERLKHEFPVNWTTILVGWEGLGIISPWPDEWEKFPPLLGFDDVCKHCCDVLATTNDSMEIDLIIDVLAFENKNPERALIRHLLTSLSALKKHDKKFELRKWRVIMLGETLNKLQKDPLNDVLAINEFWMYFRHPQNSPMKIEGIELNKYPEEFGTDSHLVRTVDANKKWLKKEMREIAELE